ncbi:MAG: thermonuclease family protein [Verrucomicrobiales bacterium]
MDTPRTGLSLLITIGIMLALGVVGAVHRGAPNSTVQEAAGVAAEGGTPTQSSPEPSGNPLHPPPVAEWDVLTACSLAANKTDAAHHFHVKRGDDIYVFQLYYANAPEVTAAKAEQVTEQARYFGIASQISEDKWDKALAHFGEDARAFTHQVLAEQPFLVFTKWEKRPETHHYYAFVLVQDENAERRLLQEMLVERGYAIISEPPLKKLPDGTSGPEFVERLQYLQRQAQQKNLGVWAGVRGRR